MSISSFASNCFSTDPGGRECLTWLPRRLWTTARTAAAPTPTAGLRGTHRLPRQAQCQPSVGRGMMSPAVCSAPGRGAGRGASQLPECKVFRQTQQARPQYGEFLMIGVSGLWQCPVSEALIGITHLEPTLPFWGGLRGCFQLRVGHSKLGI